MNIGARALFHSRRHITSRNVQPDGRAFTLIELLVVIAVMGILGGLLLPALARSKGKALETYCLNNHRQLALALQLYADDHADSLPYNFGAADTRQSVASMRYLNWVNNVMSWELDSDNTNTYLVTAGGLGLYSRGAPHIFRCPSDSAVSEVQRQARWTHRVRSISLNAMLGYAGGFMKGASNTNNPSYRQFFKLSQVQAAGSLFSFLDEHPDSINDGYFLNRLETLEWVDLPASYHLGAANFAFVDGHAESHRWRFARTRPPARPDAALLPMRIPTHERADFDWVAWRTSVAAAQVAGN